MSKYKYLFWDIDGTVLDFLAAEKAAIKTLFIKYGFGECTDEMVERYSAINVRWWQMLERNEKTKPEILVGRFDEFFRSEGLDASKAPAFNSDYQIALGDTIVFCDDAYNILNDLRNNYTLVAITNGTAIAQKKKLKNSGLNDIFDYIFISEEVGFEKPNREYFDIVLDKLPPVSLSDILIIGDSLTSDIKGGLNMGIDTCWYNPRNEAENASIMPKYTIHDLHEVYSIINSVM